MAFRGLADTWSGTIAATRGPFTPQAVPISVAKRHLVTVTVGGQVWTGCSRSWHGPAGSYDVGDRDFGYTCGILILRLAEHDIAIEGGARTFVAPHSGQLSFYVNDENPGNNEGAYSVTVTTWSPVETDADEDGLADALEDTLLDFYAPHLRHSRQGNSEEDVLPCDAWWFLRNSQFEDCGWQEPDPSQAPFFAEWQLFGAHGCDRNVSPNHLDTRGSTDIHANIENDYRNGLPPSRIVNARGIGLYGRALPVGDTILLQYWQFYAANDIDIDTLADYGEHEGDWELVEVVVDKADPLNVGKMVAARWYAHKGSEPQVRWHPGVWNIRGGAGTRLGDFPAMPAQHVPVFIERGSHGFWPTQWKYNDFVGGNNGQSYAYIPPSVQNVGEVFRPRLGMEVVLHFNGHWGKFTENDPIGFSDASPPTGPVQQNWPAAGPDDEVRYVGKWDHGSHRSDGVNAPKGRISWPHQTMTEAATANASASRAEMHIYPGNYPGAVTVSTPTTLKAPYGNVTIGQ